MNLLQRDELREWDWDAEGQDQEELKQRFEITGLDSLNWAFRKLQAIQAKTAEIAKLAEQEVARIKYWEQEQKQQLTNDIQFFEGLIQEYHAKQLASDPKAKTISTPYGKSSSRVIKAQPDKANEAELLAYVKENKMPEFIKIKEELKWGDLKKTLKVVAVGEHQVVVDANGEVVPGAIVKQESISYSIEAK